MIFFGVAKGGFFWKNLMTISYERSRSLGMRIIIAFCSFWHSLMYEGTQVMKPLPPKKEKGRKFNYLILHTTCLRDISALKKRKMVGKEGRVGK